MLFHKQLNCHPETVLKYFFQPNKMKAIVHNVSKKRIWLTTPEAKRLGLIDIRSWANLQKMHCIDPREKVVIATTRNPSILSNGAVEIYMRGKIFLRGRAINQSSSWWFETKEELIAKQLQEGASEIGDTLYG
jgi:hypothetical protein